MVNVQLDMWTESDVSRGVGDTLAKVFRRLGVAYLVEIIEDTTGWACGCDHRQVKINEWLPYDKQIWRRRLGKIRGCQ